jgi:5-methylcytosine-specific restriction protein B
VWLQKGSASLAAASLREIDPPVPLATLKAAVEQDYQHKSYAVREGKVAEFDVFCNRMRVDDYLLTTSRARRTWGGSRARPPTPCRRTGDPTFGERSSG